MEFQELINKIKNPQDLTAFRQQNISAIEKITGRPLIIYAAKIESPKGAPTGIAISDIEGFSDVVSGIPGPDIDILINSPGGSAEATERIVRLLRRKYKSIHYLVPHSAYSAATMMCLSGNCIYMDGRSSLGPIDPQINGIPAQEILDAMDDIEKKLAKSPEYLPAYLPMLQKYDLHLFRLCRSHMQLGKSLVAEWLKTYMFGDQPKRTAHGNVLKIMPIFARHNKTLSHNRSIGLDIIKKLPLKVIDLDEPQHADLQKNLWQLYCGIDWFFRNTAFVKLFENSRGVSWGRLYQEAVVPVFQVEQPSAPPASPPKTT